MKYFTDLNFIDLNFDLSNSSRKLKIQQEKMCYLCTMVKKHTCCLLVNLFLQSGMKSYVLLPEIWYNPIALQLDSIINLAIP
jgi:hypothetical protein